MACLIWDIEKSVNGSQHLLLHLSQTSTTGTVQQEKGVCLRVRAAISISRLRRHVGAQLVISEERRGGGFCCVCLELDSSHLDRFTKLQNTPIPQTLCFSTTLPFTKVNVSRAATYVSPYSETQQASLTSASQAWTRPLLTEKATEHECCGSMSEKRESWYRLARSLCPYLNYFQKMVIFVLGSWKSFSRRARVILTPHFSSLA